MAKTLRIRTKEGWVTKPIENLPENRLSPEEVDDNFLALETQIEDLQTEVARFEGVSNKNGNFTLALTDAWRWLRLDACDATVPLNATVAFPIGTRVFLRRVSVGATAIIEPTGVTINTPGGLSITQQHGTATLVKVAEDEWDLYGDV